MRTVHHRLLTIRYSTITSSSCTALLHWNVHLTNLSYQPDIPHNDCKHDEAIACIMYIPELQCNAYLPSLYMRAHLRSLFCCFRSRESTRLHEQFVHWSSSWSSFFKLTRKWHVTLTVRYTSLHDIIVSILIFTIGYFSILRCCRSNVRSELITFCKSKQTVRIIHASGTIIKHTLLSWANERIVCIVDIQFSLSKEMA